LYGDPLASKAMLTVVPGLIDLKPLWSPWFLNVFPAAMGNSLVGAFGGAGDVFLAPAKLLVSALGMLPLSRLIAPARSWKGRPSKDRQALAAAFVAKAVLGLQTTRQLLDRLQADRTLRYLCGWNSAEAVPHESTFSRAFGDDMD